MNPGYFYFIHFNESSWNYAGHLHYEFPLKENFRMLCEVDNKACKKFIFNYCLERFYANEWKKWKNNKYF